MQVEEYDGRQTRLVLTGMAVDPTVLGKMASRWDGKLFASPWENLVAGWCVKHWKKYAKPPGRALESHHAAWAEQRQDKAAAELVGDFLASLSGEYERESREVNPAHVLDVAGDLLKKVALKRMADEVTAHVEAGDVPRAEAAMSKYRRVELGGRAGVDLFTDEAAVRAAFDSKHRESLIDYPGALGEFFGEDLSRESLVGIMAPNKSGKTFCLYDLAYVAMTQRRKVALFGCGDQTEAQMAWRLLTRNSARPTRSTMKDRSWPCEVSWPVEIIKPKKGERYSKVRTETKTFKRALGFEGAWKACQELMGLKVKSKKSYFRYQFHPTGTVSVPEIKSTLEDWDREGWGIPDVIVIDYADILKPIDAKLDKRDQHNENWVAMSALRQELHCCLITASQADAKGFTKQWLDRDNFSEDRRKLDHCSAMVGINVCGPEKERGIWRLNFVNRRDGDFSPYRGVTVAGCLALANPFVISTW